jgi:hypothetical protein
MAEQFKPESGKDYDHVSADISRLSSCSGDKQTAGRFLDEVWWKEQPGSIGNRNCAPAKQSLAESKQARISVILVDTVGFPWQARADRDSNLYDEVLEFHHAKDLPAIAKTLKNKYPDRQFDITTATHGNSGRPNGYKLLQSDGSTEYVKYGALEEALSNANISEKSVRIFYGGCNAATGYYNAKLSATAQRYERVTYGSASMNAQGDYEPSTDFLRLYENDPRYGLLAEIKRPYPDEITAHAHSVPLEKREYKVKLEEIARLRKTEPEVFQARIREFAKSYRQPIQYYRDLAKTE